MQYILAIAINPNSLYSWEHAVSSINALICSLGTVVEPCKTNFTIINYHLHADVMSNSSTVNI